MSTRAHGAKFIVLSFSKKLGCGTQQAAAHSPADNYTACDRSCCVHSIRELSLAHSMDLNLMSGELEHCADLRRNRVTAVDNLGSPPSAIYSTHLVPWMGAIHLPCLYHAKAVRHISRICQ